MKKILLATATSVGVALGAGTLGAPAGAAVYPSSVPTQTVVIPAKTVSPGSTVGLNFQVGAGNAKISGKAQITIGGKKYTVKVVNGVAKFKFPAPKKGKKTYTVKFNPWTGSVFKASSSKLTLTVD